MMVEFVTCIIAFYILTAVIFLRLLQNFTADEILNPAIIYEDADSKIYATLLVVIAQIAFLPEIVPYWLFKLCTLGRRK
jgi:hypothetical protein